MLTEDTFAVGQAIQLVNKEQNETHSLLLWIIWCVGKVVRAFAVYQIYYLLSHHEFCIPIVGLFVFGGAALGLVAYHKQIGQNITLNITKPLLTKLSLHSLWFIIPFILWCNAIKFIGAARSILIEYTEYCIIVYVTSILGWKKLKRIQRRDVLSFYIVFLLLLFSSDNLIAFKNWSDIVSLQLSDIGNNIIGILLFVIAIILNIFRKNHSRRLQNEFMIDNVYLCTVIIGAISMIPFALYYLITSFDTQFSLFHYLAMIFYGNCFITLPYITENMVIEQSIPQMIPPVGMIISFIITTLMYVSFTSWIATPHLMTIISIPFLFNAMKSFIASNSGVLPLPMSSSVVNNNTEKGEGIGVYIRFILSNSDSRNLFIFLLVNLSFMFVELIYGIISNSLGLISDSAHMLFDCSALVIGLYGSFMSKWKPNQEYTYGYSRYEVVSGFVNGLLLVFIAMFILVEAVHRAFDPPIVNGPRLLTISIIGLLINLMGMFFFHNHEHNENIYGIYLHMLADTLGSVGVIISTLLIKYFEWYSADPLCSLFIASLILIASYPLISHSALILLQKTPDIPELKQSLQKIKQLKGVNEVYDHHFWTMGNNEIIGTLHIKAQDDADHQTILTRVYEELKGIGITDLTVQIEKRNFLYTTNKV